MAILIQISDIHLPDHLGGQRPGLTCPDTTLREVLAAIANRYPVIDALILTGDLADNGSAEAYDRLANAIIEAPWQARPPVLAISGNHDTPDGLNAAGQRHGWMTRGVWAPGISDPAEGALWRVALLDSHVPGQVHGDINDDTIDGVESILLDSLPEADRDRARCIAFIHHPPVAIDSPWMDRISLKNADRLRRRLERWPGFSACGFGHAHQAFADPRGQYFGTPSTWVQFMPGADQFQLDDTSAPGWRVWTLQSDGRFTTDVERLDATENAPHNH
ncbi:MAG: metallophosphoesterase [Thioalkalivibrionaceae bacterium]